MIKTHKRTGQKLLLKNNNGKVSTLYLLDDKGDKILDKNKSGRILLDSLGRKRYKIAICLNQNLI